MSRAPELLTTAPVPLADIAVEGRLRPVSDAAVTALMQSIGDLGQLLHPIQVRKVRHKGGQLRLIAGAHRLEAAQRLGWDEIPAQIWDCTDDAARLMECDDNIAHAELDPLELAQFLAERKRVYERMHPEAKRGGDRRSTASSDQTDTMSVWSFAKTVAEKRGLSERHVFRILSIGEALGPDQVAALRAAPARPKLADLTTLAKAEHGARIDMIRMMSAGEVKTAAQASRALRGAPVKLDSADDKYRRLDDIWARSPKSVRRTFVADHADELRALLADMEERS